ncbi:hypothetical protein CVT25_010689 [Psilocybe cyanescens]|uniref:Ribosomal protein/NADH dehydrogenase domain-containing protein n=1 Tax=Psilocybe cyanescens TaxID=93625 RepID=A0A409WK67_PSICY|nr:hypothetical protein CVT25_010689 [Psilocybe cyanescens]
MPPRSETLPAGVIRLTNLLAHLNSTPRLTLSDVKRLRLSLASQNDHFGARHFVKENLPQIRWANPNLDIEVRREKKTKSEQWKAEMELEFNDGNVQKVDINDKRSTTILKELMDTAGGDPWKRHVIQCEKTGQPLLPGEELGTEVKGKSHSSKLPTLEEYLAKHPEKKAEHVRKQPAGKKLSTSTNGKPSPPLSSPFATSTSAAPPN